MNNIHLEKYLLLLIIVVCISGVSQAQILNQKMQWNSVASVNLDTGDSLALSISFVSTSSNIEMIHGRSITAFSIQETGGDWQDLAEGGILTCQIKDDSGTPGIIKLGKDSMGLFVIIDMTPGNIEGMKRRFIIDSYQKK